MNVEIVLNKVIFFILMGIKLSSQTKRIFGGIEADERKIIHERDLLKSVLTKQSILLLSKFKNYFSIALRFLARDSFNTI